MPREPVYKDLQKGILYVHRTSSNWNLVSTHTRKRPEEERKRQEESRTGLCVMALTRPRF